MDVELRRLVRKLEKQGATVTGGHKHYKVYKDNRIVMVLPRTSNADGINRRWLNMLMALRRAGFKV